VVRTASHGRRRRTLWLLVGSLAVTTCTDQTGPDRPVRGHLALAPRFEASSAGIVPVARGRFTLTRQPGGEVSVDTIITIAPDADSVDLAFTVFHTPGETFLLSIRLVGPAGDTVFQAGPLEVTPSTTPAPTPIDVPLVYTGVGADAVSVSLIPPAGPIVAGASAPVIAAAFGSDGQPIPGTPIAFRSLDSTIATVPDDAIGAVLGVARGSARVVAELLTGPADTGVVSVILPPSVLLADSGSGQVGPAAGLLPVPLVARVTASDGVGVADIWVRFAATLGGGSVSADSVLTDATGRARVTWILGNVVGTQTVTATAAGVPAPSVVFTATSQATGPGVISMTAGNNQSALVSTAVAVDPQVRVTDPQANPVANVQVTFAVTLGGGNVTGAVATTDVNGVAAVGSWVLGPAAGLNALTATVSGISPLQFLALGTGPGGVTSMTLNAGNGQTALARTAVAIAPSVLVTDTAGTPIAGVEVTFAVTAGSGTLADTTPVSDANGIASVGTWTLGAVGANALSASLTGLADVPFTATGTVGPPAQMLIVSGGGQTGTAGTALPLPLVVEVQDAVGNPVPTVLVTWNTPDGSVTPPSGNTDGTGRAQTAWTLSTNRITQTATAVVSGLTPAVFTATAVFPNPSILLSLVGTDRVRVGDSETLELTLTAPAGINGLSVNVASSNPTVLEIDPRTEGTVFIADGGTVGQITVNGLAGGTATITATAAGYADGVLAVPVSVQVLSMPGTLNVPFGSTASLPLQISTAAPAGGVLVTLVSSDVTRVAVQTPTVLIPEGQQTANATVVGVFPGSATVTGSTAEYGLAQSVVSTTAALNVVQATLTINASFGDPVTVELQSGGVLIPAPAGGLAVTLTPRNPACAAAVSPVTILAGLVNTTSMITYGGSAAGFPCTSWVVATAPDIQPDSVNVTVNAPPVITETAVTVGAGLQESANAVLGASNHGGVNVTITSTDPAAARVAPNAGTAGTDFIVVPVADGTTAIPYYIQGMEGVADTVSFVYAAPGFVPDTVVHTVVQPQLDLSGVVTTTTTLSGEDAFQVRIGLGNGTGLTLLQEVRTGGTALTATVTSSVPTVARLVTGTDTAGTVTVQIPVGSSSSGGSVAAGGVALDPLAAGTTTVTATIPGVFTTTTNGVRTVTITAPALTETGVTVGAGLQEAMGATLGAGGHGGVDVIIKSLNPAVALVSPNITTAGTDSIVVPIVDGVTNVSYYIQGVENVTGTPSFVYYTNPALFVPDTVVHAVVQPQLDVSGVSTTTTTLAADDPFTVRVGLGNGAALTLLQEIRAGGTAVTATVTSSVPTVGQLVTTSLASGTVTVQIPVGASASGGSVAAGGVALDPLTAGSTTVTATIPGFFTTTTNGVRSVTITAPAVTETAATVGAGLQEALAATLGATGHGGVDVIIKSLNPALALVSPNATTAGTDSIVVAVADGANNVPYYIQGMAGVTGSPTFVYYTNPALFVPDTVAHTVAQPQLDISGLVTTTTTLSPDDPFTVRVGLGTGSTLTVLQEVRAGGVPLTATVTSSPPTVGQLVTTPLTSGIVTVEIPVLASTSGATVSSGGVAFDPLTTGTATVTATIPGLVTTTNGTRTVLVNTPSITVNAVTVGAGLQESTTFGLSAGDHGGVSVIIESSNPGVALVSPNATTAGSASIIIPLADGVAGATYYVHGVDGQTGTVTISARATGFTDGSNTASVVQPALDISGLLTTTTAGAVDDPFQVRVGIGTTSVLNVLQEARAGGPGFSVTVTSSVPAAGQLVTTALTGASVTIAIAPGVSATPGTVALGGAAFDALTAGTTTVSAAISGFVTTTNGARVVTINP
jgi:adhesin/invasin